MYDGFSSDAKKIRDYWKPSGEIDIAHRNRIKKAMKDGGVREASIPAFLYHNKYRSKRAAVARLLEL